MMLCRLGLLGIVAVCALGLAPDDGPSEFPRVPPTSPEASLKNFRVQGGFKLDLIAAEPLVMDPVAAAYDEDGRLFVVEMSDYPHVKAENDQPFAENLGDPPVGRVRRLIDSDDDGRFDRGEIFADKISWPTGIAVWKGGVFVAATPDILYLKDTDGDGKADVRETVFTGFRKFNVQAVMNNLQWGLDHSIYGAGSSNGGTIRVPGDASKPGTPLLRRDFKFDAVARTFEPISGGARFGNTFDDWGNRFLCDIRNPAQHVVMPIRYLERNPHLPATKTLHDAAVSGDAVPVFRISPPEPWREFRAKRWASISKPLPRSELVGAGYLTSSSGLTVYRGDAYPESYRGNLFLGEVANNLIFRMKVEPDGVTFKASRADAGAEFIASTDTWFRPVNFVNAPDGTLHALDMYRETIEHPWSIPDDIRARLDLRSGEDRGRIYRITPPDFRRRPTPKLGRASTAELVALLSHPNAWHRETAHRLIFERQDRSAIPALLNMLREGQSPLGRLHALWSLKGLDALSEEALIKALADPSAGVREHAVRLAEPAFLASERMKAAFQTNKLAEDPDPRVRFQVALTVGGLKGIRLAGWLGSFPAADFSDPWMRAALLSANPQGADSLLPIVWKLKGLAGTPGGREYLRSLASVAAGDGQGANFLIFLNTLASPDDLEAVSEILLGLGEGLSRSGGKLSTLRPLAEGLVDEAFARAAKLATDSSLPLPVRERAVGLLRHSDDEELRQILMKLVAQQAPAGLQVAAVRALGAQGDDEAATILIDGWKGESPAVRGEVINILLSRPGWTVALLGAVEAGKIPANSIPLARRETLIKDRAPKVRELAGRVFLSSVPSPRTDVLRTYRPAIERARDAERGRSVYDRECATCHKLGERGFAVGPNLASVQKRTVEELLTNILDPNREVAPDFVEHTVALKDGRVASGLVAGETATSVTLRRAGGVEESYLRGEIEEVAAGGKSLMPEGLEKNITPEEMANLITFLLRLQTQ